MSNNLKRKSEWMASRLVMQLADAVVLLTPAYRDELRQKLGRFYRGDKVRIIPNGIDTNRFAPAERDLSKQSKTLRLGMAARFTDKKRQDLLIEMLALLRQQPVSVRYHLSLAGDGETWKSVHEKAKEMGVEEFISLPGYLGEDELLEWFRSIDIYLHASEGETLSTSLLQAMSMGLPIVASNVSGIRNLLDEKRECGVLVDNSGKSFADAVDMLANDPEKAKALSLSARELAVDTYSQNAMFDLYNQTIKEII